MKVLAVGIALLVGACQGADDPSATQGDVVTARAACSVVSTTPHGGAAGVAVGGALSVTWSNAIDAASLAGRVTLRTASGDTVPVSVALDARRTTATVTPAHTLRYWGSYVLAVADGVKNVDGRACAAASASFATVVPRVAPRALRPAAAHGLIRAGGYAIAASAQYRGLQVYRVDAPNRIALVRDLPTDVEPTSLRAEGDRAYAPAGFDGVLVFSIADPSRPVQLARVLVPGVANDVAPFAAGGRRYLAVAERPAGVRVLDVTDARHALDLGAVDPSGVNDNTPFSLSLDGSLLAVADAPRQGFSLISLADPAHPALLSSTALSREGTAVALAGGIAYAGVFFYGIDSYDVHDPAHPSKVAHVDGPHGPCGFDCKDGFFGLVVDRDRLWAPLAYSRAASWQIDGHGGMTPANVLPVAGSALSLVAEGDFVFVGAEEGLVVFPRDAGDGVPPTWFDPSGHGTARSVAFDASGRLLYAAAQARGLQTFSLAAPLAPALLDVESTPGSRGDFDIRAAELLVTGSTIFVGDGRGGLTVFDGATPAHPRELANAPSQNDQVEAMQRAGDVLYTCHDNAGMFVYDVAAAVPRELARLQLDPAQTACLSLRLAGNRLYIGGNTLLAVADVTDPAHPALISETAAPDHAGFLSIDLAAGGRALLAQTAISDPAGFHGSSHRAQAFDLADPAHPRWTWASPELRGSGSFDAVRVRGEVGWVAAKDAGIYVYDLSDPLSPVLEGTIVTPGSALGLVLAATRDLLYVAQGEGGVVAVSLGGSRGGGCDDDDDDQGDDGACDED